MFQYFSDIELVSETTEEELKSAEGSAPELVAGLKVAYTTPAPTKQVELSLQAVHVQTVDSSKFR